MAIDTKLYTRMG